jgi:hypothetical protein
VIINVTKISYDKKEVQQKLNEGMTVEEIVEQANIRILL